MGIEIIAGALVSVIVDFLKKKFGTNKLATLASVLILSLIAAGAYHFLVVAGYWESALKILITAGAVHNFIIRQWDSYQDTKQGKELPPDNQE